MIVVNGPINRELWDSSLRLKDALNIPIGIDKRTVGIVTQVELIKKGDKAGCFEAALLSKLGIKPFSYQ
ncbi:hypothetical protein Pfo_005203 [Paulownia fortunei]|nr:hypothetical protein Pfo_005203 [Paulownia fortunei]